jgi:hypothetical protein
VSIGWSRNAQGQYTGILTGDTFTTGKTVVFMNQPIGNRVLSSNIGSTTTILLACKDFSGNAQDNFSNLFIEIRIYP